VNPVHSHAAGYTRTPEYQAWDTLQRRAEKYGHELHEAWRGRGGFAPFFAHVGERPDAKHRLTRIDRSKGFVPGNLVWAVRPPAKSCKRPRREQSKEVGDFSRLMPKEREKVLRDCAAFDAMPRPLAPPGRRVG
jgi:hypothetical protein